MVSVVAMVTILPIMVIRLMLAAEEGAEHSEVYIYTIMFQFVLQICFFAK